MLRQAASQAQQIAKAGRLLQGRRSTPAWITQILDSTRQDLNNLSESGMSVIVHIAADSIPLGF